MATYGNPARRKAGPVPFSQHLKVGVEAIHGQGIRHTVHDLHDPADRRQAAGDAVDRVPVRFYRADPGLFDRHDPLFQRACAHAAVQAVRVVHARHAGHGAVAGGLLRHPDHPARHERELGDAHIRQRHSRQRIRRVRAVAEQRRVHVRDDPRRDDGD